MKKVITGMVLLFAIVFSAFSQTKNITVAGRIIEDDTKEPAVQASVQLLSLPDSTFVTGIATTAQGYFTLPKVQAGNYVLKVSYIGFQSQELPMKLSSSTPNKNIGTLTLQTDAVMLAEAVVVAEAPQVQVVEDTLVFNSSAYRTPEGSMLEDLVKKLPGAEVDDAGNVKINGKDLKKIMVNGKEFFGGDVATGLKNLPVDMIDKLKTYDKQSDLARITGIDDGEEETVLDLTVKKGMNQGWFGNADVGVGTEKRYTGRLTLNRMVDATRGTLIASANNVNNRRRSNGLNAPKELGFNFATESEKLELGGSARYNYMNTDVNNINSSESVIKDGRSFSNSNSINKNRNQSLSMEFRMEWKPDSMTNIIFRPNFSYGKADNYSMSQSGTFNSNPFELLPNPNNYLNFDEIGEDDPLKDIRVQNRNNGSLTDSKDISADATLQLNRRLNNKGRNVTLRARAGFGDDKNDRYSESLLRYYQVDKPEDIRNQYITTPSKNHNYSAQITYSEPIARATFLQFSYQFQYRYTESDKNVFDLWSQDSSWGLGDPLPTGYEGSRVDSLGKYAEYKYYNHDASISLRFIREKYRLNVGLSFQPQNSKLSYEKGAYMIDTTRTIFNFTPNVNFRYRFSKTNQLEFTYRGRASQPNMENLLPIVDDSNPSNVRIGNPGLKPSFTHSAWLSYNGYNAELQRGIMANLNFSSVQNSTSNSTEYDESTGNRTTTPKNINGNWNASGMFGFNTALKNKKFTISSYSSVNYRNEVSYLYDRDAKVDDKNTLTELNLRERLRGAYRNDWLEVGLNGSVGYSTERSKLNPEVDQELYNFSYGASVMVMMPWGMEVSTDIGNDSRRGYRDASMNRNELIWNAQLSQTFLKGDAIVSFELYDILSNRSNISRSFSADGGSSLTISNGINSYGMLHFIYKLNVFGSKSTRQQNNNERGSFGGQGGRRQGGGGFGGGRRF